MSRARQSGARTQGDGLLVITEVYSNARAYQRFLFLYAAPQALHSVFFPRGPLRHIGVWTAPHATQRLISTFSGDITAVSLSKPPRGSVKTGPLSREVARTVDITSARTPPACHIPAKP